MQKILFATDLSFFGSYLLRHVYQLAIKETAKITIVHAVEPLGVFADAVIDAYVSPEVVPHIKSQGIPAVMSAIHDEVIDSLKLELLDANLDPSVIDDIIIARGNPTDIILSTADTLKADIIVMGSSGPRNQEQDKPLLGSVVSKVLQLSRVPVLMVPVSPERIDPNNKVRKLAG